MRILDIDGFISESAKKVIRRNLPIRKYKIIDCHSTTDMCYCDNCDKLIKNIATIEDENNNVYNVGLDCAETLSGITEFDIEYWKSQFGIGKKIRTKLLKYIKEYGDEYYIYIDVPFSDNHKYLVFVWHNEANPSMPYTINNDTVGYLMFEDNKYFETLENLVKYCPDIANKCMYNKNWKYHPEFDTRDYSFIPESGQKIDGFKLEYGIRPCGKNDMCSYATISKNGKTLGEWYDDNWTYNVYKQNSKNDTESEIKENMIGSAKESAAHLYMYWKWFEGAEILSDVIKA